MGTHEMFGALLSEWYQVAGIVLAVPVALTLCWFIVRGASHLFTVHEAITGRAKGPANDKIPSMIERFEAINDHLTRQDTRLGDIEGYLKGDRDHPFRPNGLRSVNGK